PRRFREVVISSPTAVIQGSLINRIIATSPAHHCCRRRRRLVLAAETVRVILALPRALTPLVIPDQADYCDEHGRDRPGGNASDKNEEEKLGDVIPGCFSAEEFTAQFVEGGQLCGCLTRGGTHQVFRRRTIVVIRYGEIWLFAPGAFVGRGASRSFEPVLSCCFNNFLVC